MYLIKFYKLNLKPKKAFLALKINKSRHTDEFFLPWRSVKPTFLKLET
jgi:hypothetical protein